MIGSASQHARLAQFPIDVTMRDGSVRHGVPEVHPGKDDQVDHTGLSRHLTIGDEWVELDDIIDLRVASPAPVE